MYTFLACVQIVADKTGKADGKNTISWYPIIRNVKCETNELFCNWLKFNQFNHKNIILP